MVKDIKICPVTWHKDVEKGSSLGKCSCVTTSLNSYFDYPVKLMLTVVFHSAELNESTSNKLEEKPIVPKNTILTSSGTWTWKETFGHASFVRWTTVPQCAPEEEEATQENCIASKVELFHLSGLTLSQEIRFQKSSITVYVVCFYFWQQFFVNACGVLWSSPCTTTSNLLNFEPELRWPLWALILLWSGCCLCF